MEKGDVEVRNRLVLAAVVVILLAVCLPAQVLADETEGSRSTFLRWEVHFGANRYGDTRWYIQSGTPTQVYSWVYFRWGASGVLFDVGQAGVLRWFAGPPSAYEATGFQLATSASTPSFTGVRWNSSLCGVQGPKFVLFRRGGKWEVVVTNATIKMLLVSVNGKRERKLLPGQVFSRRFPKGGEIRLLTPGGGEAAAVWMK